MNMQIEKLTAALASAKAMVNELKAEKKALQGKFKEELQAIKATRKSIATKTAVKKAATKKTEKKSVKTKKSAPVKKAKTAVKSPTRVSKPTVAAEKIDNGPTEILVEDTDLFPLGD